MTPHTTPTRSAIATTGLRKSFGDHVVLDGVDLDVGEGTIFALLGPNGAGKTTIVQILSTLLGADAGELSVASHDLARDPDAGLTPASSASPRVVIPAWPTSTSSRSQRSCCQVLPRVGARATLRLRLSGA